MQIGRREGTYIVETTTNLAINVRDLVEPNLEIINRIPGC